MKRPKSALYGRDIVYSDGIFATWQNWNPVRWCMNGNQHPYNPSYNSQGKVLKTLSFSFTKGPHVLRLSVSPSFWHGQIGMVQGRGSLRASSSVRSGGGAGKGRKTCNYVSRIWIPPPIPLWLPINWAVRFPPIRAMRKQAHKCKQTLKNTCQR